MMASTVSSSAASVVDKRANAAPVFVSYTRPRVLNHLLHKMTVIVVVLGLALAAQRCSAAAIVSRVTPPPKDHQHIQPRRCFGGRDHTGDRHLALYGTR